MEYLHKFLEAPIDVAMSYGLPFIIVLSLLVFVHEWGHYIVARMYGVRVETFSIGFGREIIGWNDKNKTRWKISWLPLGGYVQMFGDLDPASAQQVPGIKEGDKTRPFTEEEKKVAFFSQTVGRRAAIVFAGPAINFIFAIILMTGLFATEGQPYTPPIAAKIVEGSPAEKAGIKPDDKIIEVNGQKINKFQDLVTIVTVNLDREMDMKVVRLIKKGVWSEKPISLKVTPKVIEETDRFGFKHQLGRIGISGPKEAFEMREHTVLSAFNASVVTTWDISVNTLKAVGQMIMGMRSKDELGGILRIGAYAGESAKQGIVALINFAALLSVNLGLINLFPVPMLDGGHLAFYAMEAVNGKPLSGKAQEYALRVGLAMLMSLMLFATWNDLVQMKIVDYLLNLIS